MRRQHNIGAVWWLASPPLKVVTFAVCLLAKHLPAGIRLRVTV